jgi:hypothetical protein
MSPASFLGPFQDVPAGPPSGTASRQNELASFLMQPQEHSEWCWAAVAASVSDFYAQVSGTAKESQCAIASRCLTYQCCPPLPPGWNGNTFWALENALGAHLAQGPIDGPLSFSDIVTEIDAKRPVCCRISFDGVDGHFNAIVGYDDTDDEEVIIRDPLYTNTNSRFPYATFVKNYQGGSWDNSYRTK